jgi:hypothetical protein
MTIRKKLEALGFTVDQGTHDEVYHAILDHCLELKRTGTLTVRDNLIVRVSPLR